jgi:tetratricopeptide (TPR) repeat protein
MSDNHPTTSEQDARRESFVAELTSAAYPLVLRRGLKGSWIQAVLKMPPQRVARRTMGLAVLLVIGMAASEVRAQPPFGGPPPMGGPPMGGPPMGGPPMGGMMGPPRFGPAPMPGGLFRPPTGSGGVPAGPGPGMGVGRPPGGGIGVGRAPGALPASPGFSPGRGLPPTPTAPPGGRPAPGGAGVGPADRGAVGAGGRPEPGRTFNPRHADWYHGGWANSRGGTSSNPRHADWYHGGWANSRGGRSDRSREYEAAAWGFYAGSSLANGYGYSSGYGSGSGYSSGYGSNSGYGYGDAYVNPYYDASSTGGDNSSTVAAQETKSDRQQNGAAAEQGDQTSNPGPDGTKTATDSAAAADRGYQAFDRARDAFKAGDYAAALDLTDAALKDVPGDPLVHEFKALALFARGEYARAAAELHDVLADRPGMDWTTLSGLYPDVETYTGQLRALEDRCRRDPNAAAPRFVLAYHYLAAGHNDAAVAQLKALTTLEPGDRVARRLLASLTGTLPAPPEPTTTRAVPDRDGAAGRPPSVDLVGHWRGERDGSTFDLSLDGRGRFVWQAARDGKATATVSGAYALSGDTLTLKAEDRSPLRASVTELSPDSFRLKTVGDIPGDPGLGFRRVAMPAERDRDQRGGPRENR